MLDLEQIEKDLNGFENLYPNSLIGKHCRTLLDQVKIGFQVKDVDTYAKEKQAVVEAAVAWSKACDMLNADLQLDASRTLGAAVDALEKARGEQVNGY